MRISRGSTVLFTLAWPIAVSRAAPVVVGLGDALLVGHLGQQALAATTSSALNVLTALMLPLGVVSSVAAFSSQLTSAGDGAAPRRFALYGLAVALLTQIAACAVLPAVPWALAQLGHAPDVRALSARYLRLRLLSAGATVGVEALACYFNGRGEPRLPMAASVLATALNLAGDWLLVDGRLGLPAMGVAGCALAGTLANSFAFLVLLLAYAAEARRGGGARGRLSARELGGMLRVGLPVGVSWFVEVLASTCFLNVVVAGFGTTTFAALLIVHQINLVAALPSLALASAGAILVGRAIGAGEGDAAPTLVRRTLAAIAGWQAISALAYLVFARDILAPFVTGAPNAAALIDVARLPLVLSSAWMLCESSGATYVEALAAAGDTRSTLAARLVVLFGLLLPGSWALVHALHAGPPLVIGWFVACGAALVGIFDVRFRRGVWRRLRLADLAAPPASPLSPGETP